MATTLFSPISSLSITTKNRDLGFLSKSSFLLGSLPFSSSSFSHHGNPTFSRRCFKPPCAQNSSSDRVPKQFRQDNLKDGMMDNFKNVPQYLYGLPPSQMDMFMTEYSPIRRLSEKFAEESISSKHSTSLSLVGGRGIRRGSGREPPFDLPSIVLDARVVFLGMPIVPAVTELIVSQFVWLDYDDSSKPIYMYINSTGSVNEEMESVGSETDAYAIADAMSICKSDVYTLNMNMAYGQAAMLLSLGKKGFRALMPHCSTKLYLPEVYKSSGPVSDMWIMEKELEANTDSYIDLLAKGIGKSKEELAKDIQHSKFFMASDAIEYGIADKILKPSEKRDQATLKGRRGQAVPGI